MGELENGHIAMSTGVVFRVKDVPVLAFEAMKKKMARDRPTVPTVYFEDKARDEPNPNDEGYVARMEDWDSALWEKLIDVALVLGVEIESVPEGFPKSEDDLWASKLKKLGLDVPPIEQADERQLAWMKLCAAPTTDDISSLVTACARNAGVTEEDVADASATFRSRAQRRADRKAQR